MRIAVLDDDPAQLEHVVHTLTRHLSLPGDSVTCVTFQQGEDLRRALRRETFDVLLLDWNVPDLDGAALLQWLRNFLRSETRVIMISSRTSEHDVAKALGWGADDYIIKPFRPLELCARVRRLVSWDSYPTPDTQERYGGWWFERADSVLCRDALDPASPPTRVKLTERESRLALALLRNVGRVVSRAHLMESAGYDGEKMSRLLDSHVYRLRTKLDRDSGGQLRLQTVYGQGYRLQVHYAALRSP